MGKEHTKDLLKFLKAFPKETQQIALWLRDFVWDRYPTTNELIYDNYNALAFGWSPTDKVGHTFCNVAIGRSTKNILFGFYWGSEIADPKKMLLGNGNQFRYIHVSSIEDFPKTSMIHLIKEAYANSYVKVKDPKQFMQGHTFMKSISPVKRSTTVKAPKKAVKAKKSATKKKK